MSYSDKVLKLLWAKSGGICAFPGCNEELIINNTDEIIGNICHIVAKKSDGPRGDNNFPKEQLNAYNNLILLCPNHHDEIDKQTDKFTIEVLERMKREHEEQIHERLNMGQPWKINMSSQMYYINVPRIAMLASLEGIDLDIDAIDEFNNLHSMGIRLSSLMLYVSKIINQVKIKALDMDRINISKIQPKEVLGAIISFNDHFRTKGVPTIVDYETGKFKMKGDSNKDPKIYKEIGDYKIVMSINPRWITTDTAFGEFRTKRGSFFTGLCIIKRIDKTEKIIYSTPLVIGIPKTTL